MGTVHSNLCRARSQKGHFGKGLNNVFCLEIQCITTKCSSLDGKQILAYS